MALFQSKIALIRRPGLLVRECVVFGLRATDTAPVQRGRSLRCESPAESRKSSARLCNTGSASARRESDPGSRSRTGRASGTQRAGDVSPPVIRPETVGPGFFGDSRFVSFLRALGLHRGGVRHRCRRSCADQSPFFRYDMSPVSLVSRVNLTEDNVMTSMIVDSAETSALLEQAGNGDHEAFEGSEQ